jgi:hypothetical protein
MEVAGGLNIYYTVKSVGGCARCSGIIVYSMNINKCSCTPAVSSPSPVTGSPPYERAPTSTITNDSHNTLLLQYPVFDLKTRREDSGTDEPVQL